MAHRVWYLHVSRLVLVTSATVRQRDIIMYSCHFPNRSWEFFTTLDYEWSVIRRHRPYRWTVWVRDDRALL